MLKVPSELGYQPSKTGFTVLPARGTGASGSCAATGMAASATAAMTTRAEVVRIGRCEQLTPTISFLAKARPNNEVRVERRDDDIRTAPHVDRTVYPCRYCCRSDCGAKGAGPSGLVAVRRRLSGAVRQAVGGCRGRGRIRPTRS